MDKRAVLLFVSLLVRMLLRPSWIFGFTSIDLSNFWAKKEFTVAVTTSFVAAILFLGKSSLIRFSIWIYSDTGLAKFFFSAVPNYLYSTTYSFGNEWGHELVWHVCLRLVSFFSFFFCFFFRIVNPGRKFFLRCRSFSDYNFLWAGISAVFRVFLLYFFTSRQKQSIRKY
jgi:hypothetical protein